MMLVAITKEEQLQISMASFNLVKVVCSIVDSKPLPTGVKRLLISELMLSTIGNMCSSLTCSSSMAELDDAHLKGMACLKNRNIVCKNSEALVMKIKDYGLTSNDLITEIEKMCRGCEYNK